MSSPNGRSLIDRIERSPSHKSRADSGGSPHTRRSQRSRSRSRDRRERHKDSKRDHEDRRGERSGRDRRSRSRERSHRDRSDRDRDRDRDREREKRKDRDSGTESRHSDRRDKDRERERERDRDRDRERDRDRNRDDDRRDRRRKREDEVDDSPETKEKEERSKRKRDEHEPAPNGSADGRHSSDKRARSRDSERRREDRPRPRDGRENESRRDDRRTSSRHAADRGPPPTKPISPPRRPPSPNYGLPPEPEPEPEEDSEARSVFVSQLAARLTARDLGYFFEDKLGEGAVRDARIVTDRISRRSKGIGYVEFKSIDLVTRALELSGTIVMGLPIMIQLTEAERNRVHAGENLNLPPGVTAPATGSMQLYVGSLHFNLTEQDIKQVFEPFGELDFVDLHRDPGTGRSKGYAFVQYKRPDDAKMALEQMDGFELAGRTLRVNSVNEKGVAVRNTTTTLDSLEDAGGGNLNAASRQALMQKLARTELPKSNLPEIRKNIPQNMSTKSVLLLNMFDPDEETERDWDKDLAEDVKGECETKYGKVAALKVEKDSQGEIYVQFESVDSAKKAIDGLNGRWFGGKQVTARFISDAIMQAHR